MPKVHINIIWLERKWLHHYMIQRALPCPAMNRHPHLVRALQTFRLNWNLALTQAAVWHLASCLTSLCIQFLTCKRDIIITGLFSLLTKLSTIEINTQNTMWHIAYPNKYSLSLLIWGIIKINPQHRVKSWV